MKTINFLINETKNKNLFQKYTLKFRYTIKCDLSIKSLSHNT